jgi:hypothetical protein
MLKGDQYRQSLVIDQVCPSRTAFPLSLALVRHARTFLYYKVDVLQDLYEAVQVSYLG